MIRWLIVFAALLLLLPIGIEPATAQCSSTPPAYEDTVKGTATANLVGYWQLDETSGTTAADYSGNGRNGTYSGATLNATTFIDGQPAPSFDGVNDNVDVFSSGLASAISTSEGTVMLWLKFASGTWTDATNRTAFYIYTSSSNRIRITKTTTNNTLNVNYIAGGTNKGIGITYSATTWTQVAITWSKAADQVKAYVNGAQSGSTLTALGTWSGAITSVSIGSIIPTAEATLGNLAHVAIWNTPLSSTQIASLYTTATGATPTPCPTTNFQIWETLAPQSTGQPGQLTRFDYVVTAGQVQINTLASALLYSVWGFFLFAAFVYLKRRRNG